MLRNLFRIKTLRNQCLAVTLAGPMVATAQTVDFEAINKQIVGGNAEAAYEQLRGLEDDLSGNAQFDYLLGLAALESGNPQAASFALERALTVDPNFIAARFAMARALYASGTYDLAKAEFETLKQTNPPASARSVIDEYLEAIEERTASTRISYYLEGGAGYDSNTNGGTGDTNVFLPVINGTITLTDGTAEQDFYATARLGAELRHKLSEQTLFRMSASGGHREYLSTDGQELTDYGVGAGLDYTVGDDAFSFDTSLRRTELDFNDYQTLFGITVAWQRTWDPSLRSAVFVQHNRNRYIQDTDSGNDSDLSLLGVGISKALDEDSTTVVSLSAYGGLDKERSTRTDGDRTLVGLSVSGQKLLMPRVQLFGSASFQLSDYSRTNALFLRERDDTEVSASVGVRWQPQANWLITPQISYRRNDSNIPLNEYDRLDAGVRAKWQF